ARRAAGRGCGGKPVGVAEGQWKMGLHRHIQLYAHGGHKLGRGFLQHAAAVLQPESGRDPTSRLCDYAGAATGQRNHAAGVYRRGAGVRESAHQRSNCPTVPGRVRGRRQAIPRHQRICLQQGCRQPSGLSRCGTDLSGQPASLSTSSCELHARARAGTPSRGHEESAMKHMKQSMQRHMTFFAVVASSAAIAAALCGCGSGPGETESNMTSFTSTETKADSAELFTVPKEQMGHLQVVAAEKGPLPRMLRLAGAVAYDAFATTPVFAAIGGPVHEILVAPGQFVQAGQPLLTVTSPDYSAARSGYIKALDAYALADKLYVRAQDLYAHGAIAEADLQQAESNRTQAH